MRGSTEVEPGLAEELDRLAPTPRSSPSSCARASSSIPASTASRPTRDLNADDVIFSFERQWKADHPYAKVSGGKYDYFADMGHGRGPRGAGEASTTCTVRITLKQPERADAGQPGDGLRGHPLGRVRRLPRQGQPQGAVRPGAGRHRPVLASCRTRRTR
ncbi:MAG: hypothetical protein MZW92_73155 [Comamonadaceae bacterium]|nr:hypothetical protein [Comamonadaceae bacterium]